MRNFATLYVGALTVFTTGRIGILGNLSDYKYIKKIKLRYKPTDAH